MSSQDTLGGVPPEAASFKAHERLTDETAQSYSSAHREMQDERLDQVAQSEREQAQAGWDSAQREKWGRRVEALKAIRPTGDPIRDAQTFFEAISFSPNDLDPSYREAFRNGDREGVIRYFRDIEQSTVGRSRGQTEWSKEFFEVKDEVVRNIIEAAERGK